jgi:uncharacterized protein (DUF362 family)
LAEGRSRELSVVVTQAALGPVAISSVGGGYPAVSPFDPDESFPEYRGTVSGAPNHVYRAVRSSFASLGYDRERLGTASWNPLSHLIQPGDRVFIKPNLCSHEFGRKKERLEGDVFTIVTHPSVVRAVVDYVALALRGEGEIIIGDNPTIDTDFAALLAATRLDDIAVHCARTFGVSCRILDLRELWCDRIESYGNEALMKRLSGDPRGESVVNLGRESFFAGQNPLLFRGVFTRRRDTIRHHVGGRHEYAVANSIYHSDVYVSVPKLKTHHKVGVTLNVKGLVGICTKKNYLVHWKIGFPSWGGDEYPEPEHVRDHLLLALQHAALTLTPDRVAARMAPPLRSLLGRWFDFGSYRGSWEGNDTCWRMAADLSLALMTRERRTLSVVDGVVGGDGNGPFCAGRREARTIIAGEDLVLTDAVAIRMMDFDVTRVRHIAALLERRRISLADVRVVSADHDVDDFFSNARRYLGFAAPSGWPSLRRTTVTSIEDEVHS